MSLSYEEWVLRAMDIEVPEGSHRPVEYPDGGFEGWIRREVLNVGARLRLYYKTFLAVRQWW